MQGKLIMNGDFLLVAHIINHSVLVLGQCLTFTFPMSFLTDTPSMRVDDGTSLCSGIEDQYFGVHTEMVCKGLQNWWHKLAPRICQGVNCDAAGELKSLGRKNQPNAGHWEKVLCEKRNLSLECLTHTKECLSITLVKCSGEPDSLGEYIQTLHCFSGTSL